MKRKIISVLLSLTLLFTAAMLAGCTQTQGKSAYELAVECGFEGTLEEWLESLHGKQGEPGITGSENEIVINTDDSSLAKYAANKGLLSAVSVYCNFEKKVSYGSFFGPISTRSYDYYKAGSGVIYKLDKATGSAYIITNYHVIYDTDSLTDNKISNDINVYLYGAENDASAIPAKFVGGSMAYDIAVLKVENSQMLRRASVAEAEIEDSDKTAAGEKAIAIGNPEMLGISVTVGHVSVVDEILTMASIDGRSTMSNRVIRIDTAINSGNSGGGLFNGEGKLIGIVNASMLSSIATGISYALPSNVVKNVADSVIFYCDNNTNEKPKRPIIEIEAKIDESYAVYDEATGLFEKFETVSVSAAASSKSLYENVKEGDTFVSIKVGDTEKKVTRKFILTDMLLMAKTGDTVEITLKGERGEYTVSIPVTEAIVEEY